MHLNIPQLKLIVSRKEECSPVCLAGGDSADGSTWACQHHRTAFQLDTMYTIALSK